MVQRHLLIISAVVAVLASACGTSGTTPAPSPSPAASVGQPTPQPTAAPTAPPTREPTAPPSVFTSPLYHYSIALPAGWTAIAATVAWDGTSTPGHTDSIVDQFQSSTGTVAWTYAAPTTKSLAALSAARTAADAATHPCPTTPEINEPITVAGEPAVFTSKHCPAGSGTLVANTAVIHNGIGYFFYFQHPESVTADPNDLAVFKTLLSGVEFP